MSRSAAENRKAEHPDNIPKASGFVLAGDTFGNGHKGIVNGAGEENGKLDSGFLRGFGDFDLEAVGDSLRPGVGINDGAKQ